MQSAHPGAERQIRDLLPQLDELLELHGQGEARRSRGDKAPNVDKLNVGDDSWQGVASYITVE